MGLKLMTTSIRAFHLDLSLEAYLPLCNTQKIEFEDNLHFLLKITKIQSKCVAFMLAAMHFILYC